LQFNQVSKTFNTKQGLSQSLTDFESLVFYSEVRRGVHIFPISDFMTIKRGQDQAKKTWLQEE